MQICPILLGTYAAILGGTSTSIPFASISSKVMVTGDTMSVKLNGKTFEERLALCRLLLFAYVVLSNGEEALRAQ